VYGELRKEKKKKKQQKQQKLDSKWSKIFF